MSGPLGCRLRRVRGAGSAACRCGRRAIGGIARLVALTWPVAAAAQGGPAAEPVHTLPMSATLGAESVRLPGGEHVGLVGGSLLFEVHDGWWTGPAVYGAASGKRGGFFVGGYELQRRWAVAERLQLSAGLFVGGGGGGAAPVGGGLMLRPALALMRDFGGFQAGLSWSAVRFPSSEIRSQQLGLLFAWQGDYRYADAPAGARGAGSTSATGLGVSEFAGTLGSYRLRDGSGRRIGLIGARAEWQQRNGWHTGIESAAAATGDAAGYMEVLASAGWDHAVPHTNETLRVGVRGALGLGGGGAMPSGGGLIAKAAATLAWQFSPGWRVGVEAGWLDGLKNRPQAQTVQVWLATDLEPRATTTGTGTAWPAEPITRNEWVIGMQRVQRADRVDGSRGPIELLGGKINRAIGEHVYLSAQAHSAYAGGAGAYSIGLVGGGVVSTSVPGRLRYGAELLVGAAGGGGIVTGGGALLQGVAWAAWPVARDSEWRLGLGSVHAVRAGGLRSPVLELSWSRAFGLSGR